MDGKTFKIALYVIIIILLFLRFGDTKSEHYSESGLDIEQDSGVPEFDRDNGSIAGMGLDTSMDRPQTVFLNDTNPILDVIGKKQYDDYKALDPVPIILYYSDCSKIHPLYTLFDSLVSEMSIHKENSVYVFVKKNVPDGHNLPRMVKILEGRVIEYKGATNFGAMLDWVLGYQIE